MHRLALAALLVGVTSGLITAQAPAAGTRNWYTAQTVVVKPGMMEEYRQLVIKELNPAAKKGGQTQATVWRYATGNTSRVLRITPHASLADRDAGPAARRGMGEAAWAAYLKKAAALTESTSAYIGQTRPDLSWNPAGGPAPKLADRSVMRVAPGRNAEYVKFIQAALEGHKKSGHRRTAGQVVFGANPGLFISNTFYENYADLEKGRPQGRVMSPAEQEALNKLNPPGMFTIVSRDVTIYDAEMSIAPPR